MLELLKKIRNPRLEGNFKIENKQILFKEAKERLYFVYKKTRTFTKEIGWIMNVGEKGEEEYLDNGKKLLDDIINSKNNHKKYCKILLYICEAISLAKMELSRIILSKGSWNRMVRDFIQENKTLSKFSYRLSFSSSIRTIAASDSLEKIKNLYIHFDRIEAFRNSEWHMEKDDKIKQQEQISVETGKANFSFKNFFEVNVKGQDQLRKHNIKIHDPTNRLETFVKAHSFLIKPIMWLHGICTKGEEHYLIQARDEVWKAFEHVKAKIHLYQIRNPFINTLLKSDLYSWIGAKNILVIEHTHWKKILANFVFKYPNLRIFVARGYGLISGDVGIGRMEDISKFYLDITKIEPLGKNITLPSSKYEILKKFGQSNTQIASLAENISASNYRKNKLRLRHLKCAYDDLKAF